MKKSSGILIGASCLLLLACQRQSDVSVQVNSPSPIPTLATSTDIKPPPSTSAALSPNMEEAEYNGYPYSYKREGETTVAMFVKRFLPRDDAIVVGAIRDVIRRAYNEDTHGAPYLVDTATAGGNITKGIRVDGAKKGYVVVPVKEDTGEIHSLTVSRVAR